MALRSRWCGVLALIGITALFLAGCASTVPLKPIDDPSRPYERFGLKFLPPQGGNWLVADDDGSNYSNVHFVYYPSEAERRSMPYRTMLLEVQLDTTERKKRPSTLTTDHEALQHFLDGWFGDKADDPRVRVVRSTSGFETFHGVEAARFRKILEDTQEPHGASRLEYQGLLFFVPDEQGAAVWITWSQRSRPQDRAPDVSAVGEAFLRNVSFIPSSP